MVSLYRTCRYRGENYLFHFFAQDSYVVSDSMATTWCPAGQVSTLYAVIENKDGKIECVRPREITFTDNEFSKYYFRELDKE